jgi:hypothetical protein
VPSPRPVCIRLDAVSVSELFGNAQYNSDGELAVSDDPAGPIIPVRVQLEFRRVTPLTIRIRSL